MDQVIERHNLLNLPQEGTDNLNKPLSINTESLDQGQSCGPMVKGA